MDDPITRGELEAKDRAVWAEMRRLRAIIEGPPHPGLDKRVSTFIDSYRAVEAERDRVQTMRHEQNQRAGERLGLRIQFWGTLIAFLALIAVAIQAAVAVHMMHT